MTKRKSKKKRSKRLGDKIHVLRPGERPVCMPRTEKDGSAEGAHKRRRRYGKPRPQDEEFDENDPAWQEAAARIDAYVDSWEKAWREHLVKIGLLKEGPAQGAAPRKPKRGRGRASKK